ncbi:hypothetical protein PLICRDRAFT_177274 [Plicaturopsis crispa FD-325 SS-3]|nr:hypothetical protein PLICRDRAFT_177274 [Plicaturopsis crispa FD-325 SS-3]
MLMEPYTCTPPIHRQTDGRNRWYIVTKGPHAGIYQGWTNGAEDASQGIPSAGHSKVPSEEDARRVWRDYCLAHHSHPAPPASPAAPAPPATQRVRSPPTTPSRPPLAQPRFDTPPRRPLSAAQPTTPVQLQREVRDSAIAEALAQMDIGARGSIPSEFRYFAVRAGDVQRVMCTTRSKALEILHDHQARGVSAELMYARSVQEAEAFLFSED